MGKTFKDQNKWHRKDRGDDGGMRQKRSKIQEIDVPDPMDLLDEELEDSWWDEYYIDED